MKITRVLTSTAAVIAVAVIAGCSPASDGSTDQSAADLEMTINLATAGDTNMLDLQQIDAIPMFRELYPNATVNAVGTGAGDAGSVAILTKLQAQKDAGLDEWDIDVAIVHQAVMQELIDNELIVSWIPEAVNGGHVIADNAKTALGTDVEGYVGPLFQSQTAIAYNSAVVDEPFDNFGELEDWIVDNPGRFGYNGVKNGASGVSFVDSWLYWKSGQTQELINGPYDASLEAAWGPILSELKALPATITDGNNGTLDLLNRGEIDAGAVWVDMYAQWLSDGRLNPDVKIALPEEGMPGQPMYVVITAGAKDKEAAMSYADFLISPEFQAEVIVDKMSWYPGIDANEVLPLVSAEGTEKLFGVITPQMLATSSLPFPIAEFKAAIEAAYEAN